MPHGLTCDVDSEFIDDPSVDRRRSISNSIRIPSAHTVPFRRMIASPASLRKLNATLPLTCRFDECRDGHNIADSLATDPMRIGAQVILPCRWAGIRTSYSRSISSYRVKAQGSSIDFSCQTGSHVALRQVRRDEGVRTWDDITASWKRG